MGEKRYFSILFGFPLGVCKTSKEKLKYWFFIFGYPFSLSEMLLGYKKITWKKYIGVGNIFCSRKKNLQGN